MWINVIIQKLPTGSFFLFYILIYFFEYETIVRSSAWSFGHSDPNPSSVSCWTNKHQQGCALKADIFIVLVSAEEV